MDDFTIGGTKWEKIFSYFDEKGHKRVLIENGDSKMAIPSSGSILWASETHLPSKEVIKKIKGRAFLLLGIEAFYEKNMVSRTWISWENKAEELVFKLFSREELHHLLSCEHMVISFSTDAAIYFHKVHQKWNAFLCLAHGKEEGYAKEKYGNTPDIWTFLVSAMATQYKEVLEEKKAFSLPLFLKPAELLQRDGYNGESFSSEADIRRFFLCGEEALPEVYEIPLPAKSSFCIGASLSEKVILQRAFSLIREGENALYGFPHLTENQEIFVGRKEIEKENVPDVFSMNPKNKGDMLYLLRRALYLRELLEEKGIRKSLSSSSFLRAMLFVPKYEEGKKSMRMVFEAMQSKKKKPVPTALSLHIDIDLFEKHLQKDARLEAYIDKLAVLIHEDYVRIQKERGESGPNVVSWAELSDTFKEANRRQARSIPQKLQAIGCVYDDEDAPYEALLRFTKEEIHILSRMEHYLWMAHIASLGYVFGEKRNDDPLKPPLTHPDLLPWEALEDAVRQKDVDTAENMIPLLHSVGLKVYRIV